MSLLPSAAENILGRVGRARSVPLPRLRPSQEEWKDGSRQVILGWGGTEADTGQLRKDGEKTLRLFEQMQEKRLINCDTHSQFKNKLCA